MAGLPTNTNPAAKSWLTGEFWISLAAGAGVLLIATGVVAATDHVVIDALTDLFVKAFTGIGAMISLVAIAVNMVNKRTDLKTTMIEQGLISEEVTVPEVETAVAETPAG